MTSPILITGGTGTLGRLVVARLAETGHTLRVLSRGRRPAVAGTEAVTGDLLNGNPTGGGLRPALAGVDTIVHLAGGPKGDDVATRNLMRAARDSGVRHVVYISVVGADRMPLGYFRAKHEAEKAITGSGLDWSLVRAAQFQELCLDMAQKLAKLPVVPAPKELRFQPVAATEVADRIVDLATGAPAGQVGDLVGPRIYDLATLVRGVLAGQGKHRAMLPLRLPGKAGKAYRAGLNLSDQPAAPAARTWEAFLTNATGRAGNVGSWQTTPVR